MPQQPSGGRFLVPRGAACSLLYCATSTLPRVVASDHTPTGIPRNVKLHPDSSDRIFDTIDRKLEEVEWLLNYARNANKPTPVASANTTKKVNAPRRSAPTRLLNPPTRKSKSADQPCGQGLLAELHQWKSLTPVPTGASGPDGDPPCR
jgi:hypothetical protein